MNAGQGGLETSSAFNIDVNPRPAPSTQGSRRKQTLIALLDELLALRDDNLAEEDGGDDASQVQAERGARSQQQTSLDEHLADEGAHLMFRQFSKCMGQVDSELQNIVDAIRPLGPSVSLISSTYYLRVSFQRVLQLFHENATNTFKDNVNFDPSEPTQPFGSRKKPKARRQEPTWSTPVEVDLEAFPEQLELLAKDLKSFLNALHDIPDFADERLSGVVLSFEADLKYWASCLKDYGGQFKYPAVGRYVNDLTKEVDEHLEEIRNALRMFRDVGIPTIRNSQSHTATGLQNLSTVATFFSGVTATTIQYSFDRVEGPLANAVNALWMSSLVFSIASAINSQLAYHWRAKIHRSSRNAVPWWVLIWLTRAPLIFLVVSVMAFSVGLICFTFSQQGWIVQFLTTVFTSFTSFAMLAVSLWFASERWTFSKTRSSKWPGDVIHEMSQRFYEATVNTWFGRVPIEYVSKAAGWNGAALPTAGTQKSNMFIKVTPMGEKTAFMPTTTTGKLSAMGATQIHFLSGSNETQAHHPHTAVPPPLPPIVTPDVSLTNLSPSAIVQNTLQYSPPARELPQDTMISPTLLEGNIVLRGAVKKAVPMQRPASSAESSANTFAPRGSLLDRTVIQKDSLGLDSAYRPQFLPPIAHHGDRPAIGAVDINAADDIVAEEIKDAHTITIGPSPIARGGNADIYLGHWVPPGKIQKIKVAVKVLRLNGMFGTIEEDEQLARVDKRLGREMRVWGRLNHPRIVPLLGYMRSGNNIVDEDAPCLVSPFYAFRNLSYYLSRYPDTDRLVLLHQAAEGLNYLHTLSPPIVHLDLKPQNILINDRKEAEICDFGVARILEEMGTGLTTSGGLGYTANFASPEILNGLEATTATDVYSFGGLALETLSGKPPHYKMGRSQSQIVLAIASGKHPSRCDHAIQMRGDVLEKLWGLLEQCWKTDPFQRPTMATVMRKLDEIRNLAMVSLP